MKAGRFGLLGINALAEPGSYAGGKMIMTKCQFHWRKPEYPEETDLRQVSRPKAGKPAMCYTW